MGVICENFSGNFPGGFSEEIPANLPGATRRSLRSFPAELSDGTKMFNVRGVSRIKWLASKGSAYPCCRSLLIKEGDCCQRRGENVTLSAAKMLHPGGRLALFMALIRPPYPYVYNGAAVRTVPGVKADRDIPAAGKNYP